MVLLRSLRNRYKGRITEMKPARIAYNNARWATKKEADMEDEKNKDMNPALEQKPEEKEEDAREIADEKLEKVAGGTVPIIKPF